MEWGNYSIFYLKYLKQNIVSQYNHWFYQTRKKRYFDTQSKINLYLVVLDIYWRVRVWIITLKIHSSYK